MTKNDTIKPQVKPQKPQRKQYRFLEAVDYAPTGKHYPVGTVAPLADWNRSHLNNAIKTGHITIA